MAHQTPRRGCAACSAAPPPAPREEFLGGPKKFETNQMLAQNRNSELNFRFDFLFHQRGALPGHPGTPLGAGGGAAEQAAQPRRGLMAD